MEYKEQYNHYLWQVEKSLQLWCDKIFKPHSKVADAVIYSVLGGGKRVRGVLAVAVCDMLSGDGAKSADFAVAIEMVHAYSLIHDDLPCMDDDDFRRGKPSCHKAFNEENALLAGDALNTAAFEVLANTDRQNAENKIKAVKYLANSSGVNGMVYGQELDLFFEKTQANETELNLIHRHKTGDLINCAVILGGIAADATDEDILVLSNFAYQIGLVFQIVDDVLDITSTEEQLGKPIGSDAENGKTTFATLKGVKLCNKMAVDITNDACQILKNHFGEKTEFLVMLAKNLASRNN